MTPLKSLLLPLGAVLALSIALRAPARQPGTAAHHRMSLPALSAAQQHAVGIIIATVPVVDLPQHINAYGHVLDPSELVADASQLESARVVARAAAAEAARLKGLYRSANTSLKALQSAEAARTEAQAHARQARATFRLHWGPLAHLRSAQRARLIDAIIDGRVLLLRADLIGRHSLGTLPRQAMVEVDGLGVPARVLGILAQSSHMQSVGVLLQMSHPPAGLGPGARLPVALDGRALDGRLVPKGALLYGQRGAYVYHVLPRKTKDGDTRFAPLRVMPLQAVDGSWLVTGLHTGDRIVVQGAGVLWSLQGLGSVAGDND
jgi:hypothetical protein